MKKVFFAIGVVIALASCGSSATSEAPKADTAKVAVDSNKVATVDSAKVDTTKAVK